MVFGLFIVYHSSHEAQMQSFFRQIHLRGFHRLPSDDKEWKLPGAIGRNERPEPTTIWKSGRRAIENILLPLFLSLGLNVVLLLLISWSLREKARTFNLKCMESLMMPCMLTHPSFNSIDAKTALLTGL
jgi:hypothetical protein